MNYSKIVLLCYYILCQSSTEKLLQDVKEAEMLSKALQTLCPIFNNILFLMLTFHIYHAIKIFIGEISVLIYFMVTVGSLEYYQ